MKPTGKTWVMLLALVVLALGLTGYDAAPANAGSPEQDTQCYTLTLEIVGGKGDLPEATPANCADGQYRAGTVVELTAQPAEGFEVYAWEGTDDDDLTTLTNTVTMDRPQVVGIHYANLDNPSASIGPSDGPGGVALAPEYPVGAESVIGTDSRTQITTTIQNIPYRWIAKLEIQFPSGSGGCTGWFAGPHTVMTAGHCVYNSAYGGWADSIKVIPAKNGGTEPYGSLTSTTLRSVTGWVNSGLDAYDYGAVILPNDSLGNLTGWFQWKNYAAGTLLGDSATITGYPGDMPYGTMWIDSDTISQDGSYIISYEVDTAPGESGSPVYKYDGGFVSYGIHTKGTASPACLSGDNCGTRINSGVYNNMLNNWDASTQVYLGCDVLSPPSLLVPPDGGFRYGSTLLLDWSHISGNGGYDVEVWQGGSRVRDLDTSANVSYVYVSGLPNGVYSWRVRAKNADEFPNGVTACPSSDWSAWSVFAYSETLPNVKINEVDTGGPDAIELYNAGSTTAFVGGWYLTFYNGGSPYTIPYYYSIPPYGYLTLYETSGASTSSVIYMNNSLSYNNFSADGAILLEASSTAVDFVRFGSSTQSYPAGQWAGANPTTANLVNLGRSPNGYDTNNGANWCLQRSSLGAANNVCLPQAQSGVNLVYNSTFSAGESGWSFFGSLVHQVSSGYLLAYNNTTPGSAGFLQYINRYVSSNSPMEVTMDIGNSSNFYKVVTMVLRNPEWTSSRACYFIIPAKSPVQTYTMRVRTPVAYPGMVVQAYVQPADGKPTLWFDNINVQYKPALPATTTPECIRPVAPANVNLMANGNFSEPNAAWRFGPNMVHQYLNGVMYMFRQVGSTFSSANMFQVQMYLLPANAPLELTLQLGNTSSVAKTAVAIVHSPDWTDTFTCYFTVQPGSPLQTYTLRGKSTIVWSNVVFGLYIQQADGQSALAVDSIDLRWKPGLSVPSTQCLTPVAPANTNLLVNGTFAAGENGWTFFGNIIHAVSSNILYVYHQAVADQAGFYQVVNSPLPANAPLEVTMQLGNTSASDKTALVLVRAADWSSYRSCTFTIPAGAAPATYTMRAKTPAAWNTSVFTVYVDPPDSAAWMTVDNLNLQYKPALVVGGTVCLDPTPEMVFESEAAAVQPDTADDSTPSEPLFGPDDTFELVEAEADIMAREGEWTVYDSDAASGTGYIFSSGSTDDILTLPFYGDGVEVVYVKHPALGTFAVEIDGEVVATVNASAAGSEFGVREIIAGLEESEHMLRILPVEGTVAIDALTVEGYFTTSSSLR